MTLVMRIWIWTEYRIIFSDQACIDKNSEEEKWKQGLTDWERLERIS